MELHGHYLAKSVNYILPYQTPPHTSPSYAYNWTSKPPPSVTSSLADEDLAYTYSHSMRYPTPPITPPLPLDSAHQESEFGRQLKSSGSPRTKSVIMKVSQGQEIATELLEQQQQNRLTESQQVMNHFLNNNSGSDSSSPANDFLCAWQDCGRIFDSLESLAQHVTQIHAVASLDDGLYYCRWHGCQRSERGFNARYKMLVHVRTHTKEKPHKCSLCEKSFSRAENLKIHIRSHSGEKPYKCTHPGCTKAYSNSSDRFKHTRTHTMEKPYKCKIPGCQKRYTDPSSLRKHVKTFKHSLQIMDSQQELETLASKENEPLIAREQKDDSSAYLPAVIHHRHSDDYDVKTELEHDLLLEKLHLKSFYHQKLTASDFYWPPENKFIKSYYSDGYLPVLPPHQASFHIQQSQQHQHLVQPHHNYYDQSYAMEMDVDCPLDLTVQKI